MVVIDHLPPYRNRAEKCANPQIAEYFNDTLLLLNILKAWIRNLWRSSVSLSQQNRLGRDVNGTNKHKVVPAILALRRDPRLLKLPPYLSALCVLIGIVWLLLLPLNQYSRHTYISENALLPGQVHTYFGGSEQNIFNAYKHEVQTLSVNDPQEYACRWLTAVVSIPSWLL